MSLMAERCKYFPECSLGDNCKYAHTDEEEKDRDYISKRRIEYRQREIERISKEFVDCKVCGERVFRNPRLCQIVQMSDHYQGHPTYDMETGECTIDHVKPEDKVICFTCFRLVPQPLKNHECPGEADIMDLKDVDDKELIKYFNDYGCFEECGLCLFCGDYHSEEPDMPEHIFIAHTDPDSGACYVMYEDGREIAVWEPERKVDV